MTTPLDATAVARAFEVMLPAHARGLALSHNEHKDAARSIGPYIDEEEITFTSGVERQKAVSTDELWVLYWHPPHDAARRHHRIAAATLPAIAQWLQDQGLAFGN